MSTTKTKLIWAENIAMQLFKAVEDRNLITAGKSEQQLNAEVFKLAFERRPRGASDETLPCIARRARVCRDAACRLAAVARA